MKQIMLIILLTIGVFGGFFKADNEVHKKAYVENERLCKIFTAKVAKYKISLRDDVLARASLASYEHRANLFCKKAEASKRFL